MSTPTPPHEEHRFDLGGPLPTGTLVLRASAGTGKTFAIAALATRAIAEGRVSLPELLIVTFTRAATAELGDRVRRRLVGAASHLEARLAGTAAPTDDPVLLALARDADHAELRRRTERLTTAVTSFDAATITTIHSFCQQALRGVGLSGADADAVVIEDQTELIEQVVSDALVARFHATGGAPPHREVVAAVRAAVAAPDAVILPEQPPRDDDHLLADDDPDARGRLVADLAREARVELAHRKRATGLRSQDDLLTGLHAVLRDPVHGPRAVAALRERYRIALIDEFQDTDPVQWAILRELFTRDGASDGGREDGRTLVLIGDPKQAIYGFRGADVRAYLDATDTAGQLATLADNHRSDERLVTALDRLLDGTVYGDPRITHAPSGSPPRLQGTALDGPGADPLELRVVTDAPDGHKLGSGTAMPTLVADIAAEVVRTLDEVTLHGRPAEPRDIAVLTRSNDDALAVQSALRSVRVPAVINSVGSVLETDAARQWQQLLDALQRPANPGTARAAAITDLLGWDATRLATADDSDLDALHAELHRLAEVLQRRGVAALRRELERTGAAARVLTTVDGDRRLTDLEHVAELLHGAQLEGEFSPAALAAWLRRRAADAEEGITAPEEQTRRLESDADAVQVLTIHRSKGLEFGIVLAPFLWKQPPGVSPPVTVHPDAGRVVDVGPKDRSGFDQAKQLKRDDDHGEQLRLLYVALTRARHRVVVWWLPIDSARRSALAAVLHARDEHDRVRSDQLPIDRLTPSDAVDALTPLLERCGGALRQVPPAPDPTAYTPRTDDDTPLRRAAIRARVDTSWRRSSYSGLVRLIDRSEDTATDELAAETAVTDDERLVDAGPVPPATSDVELAGDLDGPKLAMGTVRGGTELGTMLHAVLEHADTSAADLHAELAHHLDDQRARHLIDRDRDALLAGLTAAVTTPLGPLAGDISLHEVTRDHRLDEPRFELPLAGGDAPRQRAATVAAIGRLLDAHLPAADPLAGYGRDLASRASTLPLRGYLTGAIDLLLRVEVAGEPRYLVVDHKSNRLGPWDREPTVADYRPHALATAMRAGHYPLQSLLYQVAVHRLLRWRLPGYDPGRHLGGSLYLFLRGMAGPDTPQLDGGPCGVFAWRPPATLVVATSELLDRGADVDDDAGGRP